MRIERNLQKKSTTQTMLQFFKSATRVQQTRLASSWASTVVTAPERHALRVGGVPEHFNASFKIAHDSNQFDKASLDVEVSREQMWTAVLCVFCVFGSIVVASPFYKGARYSCLVVLI
jgi:hypothetical protein